MEVFFFFSFRCGLVIPPAARRLSLEAVYMVDNKVYLNMHAGEDVFVMEEARRAVYAPCKTNSADSMNKFMRHGDFPAFV